MSNDKYNTLIENAKISEKLLCLGLGCTIQGPKGDTGEIGPTARCNKSSIYIFKW